MTELEIQKRKNRIEWGTKILLLTVAALIAAPLTMLIFWGLLGIGALGLAAAVGSGIVYFAPVAGMKMANWRLQAIKIEAAKNPIETLQLDYQDRQLALARFREAIVNFSGSVGVFSDKVAGYESEHPEDAPPFRLQLEKMGKLLETRKRRYKEAESALADYADAIDRTKAKWEMAQEAAKMNDAAGIVSGDEFLQKVKTETAFDAVSRGMNKAFAELEVSLLDEDKTPLPELASGEAEGGYLALDVESIRRRGTDKTQKLIKAGMHPGDE